MNFHSAIEIYPSCSHDLFLWGSTINWIWGDRIWERFKGFWACSKPTGLIATHCFAIYVLLIESQCLGILSNGCENKCRSMFITFLHSMMHVLSRRSLEGKAMGRNAWYQLEPPFRATSTTERASPFAEVEWIRNLLEMAFWFCGSWSLIRLALSNLEII